MSGSLIMGEKETIQVYQLSGDVDLFNASDAEITRVLSWVTKTAIERIVVDDDGPIIVPSELLFYLFGYDDVGLDYAQERFSPDKALFSIIEETLEYRCYVRDLEIRMPGKVVCKNPCGASSAGSLMNFLDLWTLEPDCDGFVSFERLVEACFQLKRYGRVNGCTATKQDDGTVVLLLDFICGS